MGFEGNWCNWQWVVLFTFELFGEEVGVAACDGDVIVTRQGLGCSGGGNHNVKVDGASCGEKGDVGPVVVGAVAIGVLWRGVASYLGGMPRPTAPS